MSSGSGSDPTQERAVPPIPASDNQQTVISVRPPIGSTNRHAGDPTTRPTSNIKLGTKLGDIELIEHIGGGGMGQVFRGEDKRLGRAVAVKVLSCDQSADQDAVRRFLNEARSAARLNHQNIAQVYSAGESDNHPFIVFEFVEGVNLRAMIEEQGPLMLEEALSYTLQIADALSHASERQIVHRDVKPSNVLIAPSGQAKLIDLGLARLSTGANPDGDLTASGVTLGTFDYISPEQARDPRNADSRSDIYSLGCTLFYMLAGRPPFPEGTVLQKLLQHQGDEPPDICQSRPDIPDEVSLVLSKMMAKDPRRRYPDFSRLMEALLSLADQIGLRPVGPTQAVWLPPHESRISVLHRQTPWLAPTFVLACLIIVLHLVWSGRGEMGDLRSLYGVGERVPYAQATGSTGTAATEAKSATDGLPEKGGPVPATSESEAETQTGSRTTESGSPKVDTSPKTSTAAAVPNETPPYSVLALRRQPGTGNALSPAPLLASLSPSGKSVGISLPSLLGSYVSGSLSALSTPPSGVKPDPVPVSGAISAVPLIVTPTPKGNNQYASIAAALAAAPDATLVELSYDGPRTEKPLAFVDRQLTIRAGSGYAPAVVFQPTGTDPVLYPRDMIQVSAGKLTVEGVAVELEIPRDMPSESWALVRLSTGGRVSFKACALRVRNASDTFTAYHQDVAFFRINPPESPKATPTDPTRLERTPDIELRDCLACGEASFVRETESLPLLVVWSNGLLVTSEVAFSIGGNSREPNLGAVMDIDWQNVTAVTSGPLIRLALAPHRPHLVPLRFSDSACVLSSQPLIQATGVAKLGEFLSRLTWNNKTASVIQGGSSLVSLSDASGLAISSEALAKWLPAALQKSLPQRIWQNAAPAGPKHSMRPEDFSLNLAETGLPADTVLVPGFLASRVPGVPPPSKTVPN